MENGRVTSSSSFGKYRDLLRRLAAVGSTGACRPARRVGPRPGDAAPGVPQPRAGPRTVRARARRLAARDPGQQDRGRAPALPQAPPGREAGGPVGAAVGDSGRGQARLARGPGPGPRRGARTRGGPRKAGRGVAALPEDQKRAVEMHHLQGLPFAEVAARMGRSKASVAGLVFRGVLALRERLAATESGEQKR